MDKLIVIQAIAEQLANCQRLADKLYYTNKSQDRVEQLLHQADILKRLANNLEIGDLVYTAAYDIYDFRNSGKEGYTLKDGKIVKENENGK